MDLSVTIIARNEEGNLPGALASCESIADEIVVLDTGSTDRTAKIAAAHPKVKLLRREFTNFSDAKGAALEAARGDWVLVLDADERLSQPLLEKISSLRANQQLVGMGGYRIRRQTRILGRVMTSMGLQRDYPLRLFRRQGARYNERLVHEGIMLPPRSPVGQIEQVLEHYTFSGIDAYLRKIDLYTTLEISEGGRSFSLWHMMFSPPSTFVRYYFSRGGWRDGYPGFLWASMTAIGRFLRDVKLWIATLPGQGG